MEYLPEDIKRRIESQEAKKDRVWEEQKAAAAAAGRRRVSRRPSLLMSSSTHGQNQSQRIPLHSIRQYYAPPGIDTSSRKKSHTGITIRKKREIRGVLR